MKQLKTIRVSCDNERIMRKIELEIHKIIREDIVGYGSEHIYAPDGSYERVIDLFLCKK